MYILPSEKYIYICGITSVTLQIQLHRLCETTLKKCKELHSFLHGHFVYFFFFFLRACMFAVTGRCWAHRLGVILVLLRAAWFYNHPHCHPSITQEPGNSNLPYFSHFSTHPSLFLDDLSFNPPPQTLSFM